MADVTVTLVKSAKQPARVRRGAEVYTVEPGGEAVVPAAVAPWLVRQGAKVAKGDKTTDAGGSPEGSGS